MDAAKHSARTNPELEKLRRTPEFSRVVESLRDKPRREAIGRDMSLEQFLSWAVSRATAEPDVAETMTASERRKFAAGVREATTRLWDHLEPFSSEHGMRWPFQPVLDRFSLEVSIDDRERWAENYQPEEVEDMSHRVRYGIYYLLMHRLDSLLEVIDEAADWVADTDTVLKKPNSQNAKRLYFLRVITRNFVSEFRSPCRAAALALASIYFDCSDLDEAAVSKLAPVIKPTSVEITQEEFESLSEQMERSIESFASSPNAKPEQIQELRDNLKNMRETAYKVQPN